MRRSYVWDPVKKELVPKESARPSEAPAIFPDTPEFTLPGSKVVISGRRAKREYMKRAGVEEVGNDKKGLIEHTRRQRVYRETAEMKSLKSKLTEVLRDREFFRGR